jgi:hypothetical protein
LQIKAVAQPIDLDSAPPQNEPVSPVNDPIENEQLQAPNLDLDVILLFILVFVCIVACSNNVIDLSGEKMSTKLI